MTSGRREVTSVLREVTYGRWALTYRAWELTYRGRESDCRAQVSDFRRQVTQCRTRVRARHGITVPQADPQPSGPLSRAAGEGWGGVFTASARPWELGARTA